MTRKLFRDQTSGRVEIQASVSGRTSVSVTPRGSRVFPVQGHNSERSSQARLGVDDLLGREVAVLANERKADPPDGSGRRPLVETAPDSRAAHIFVGFPSRHWRAETGRPVIH